MFSVSILSVMVVDQRFAVCGQSFVNAKTTFHLNGFTESMTNEYEFSSPSLK